MLILFVLSSMFMLLLIYLDLKIYGEMFMKIVNLKIEDFWYLDFFVKNLVGSFDMMKFGFIFMIFVGFVLLMFVLLFFMLKEMKLIIKFFYVLFFMFIILSFYL